MYMLLCIYIYIYIYIYISGHSGQLSIDTSKNPSVVNTIYVSLHSATNVITCARLRLKQMWRLTKAKTEIKCEH